MKLTTEGVLVLASSKGLLAEYKDKEFDYDFPKGISSLLNQQTIIALTTMNGDNIIVDFDNENKFADRNFDKEIDQFIKLDAEDELLIMSHSEFTMICRRKGDYRHYSFPIEKMEGLEAGTYHVNIRVENLEEEFEKYEAYFRLTIRMNKVEDIKLGNEVIEIGE